jgi:hypothetical protein
MTSTLHIASLSVVLRMLGELRSVQVVIRRAVRRAQYSQLARTTSSNTWSTPEERAMSAVESCKTVLTELRGRRALDVPNRAHAPSQPRTRLRRDGHESAA